MTEFTHRSKLFWTAYVIERKLCSLIGVPPKLHDEDIGLPKPTLAAANSVPEIIMVFHVDLSSQLGEILQGLFPNLDTTADVDICASDIWPRTFATARVKIHSCSPVSIETTIRLLKLIARKAQVEFCNVGQL